MHPIRSTAVAGLATLACAAGAHAQPRQAFFSPAGDLPGGSFLSECWAISGSGAAAVGGSIVGGSGFSQRYAAAMYQEELAPFLLYDAAAGASVVAFGTNASGTVVAGKADHGSFSPLGVQAFVWVGEPGGGGTAVEIGDLPGGPQGAASVPQSIARGVSADGMFVCGIGQSNTGTEAWRYEIATGQFLPLGDIPGGSFASFGNAISGNGSVIVGNSVSSGTNGQEACMWTISQAGVPTLRRLGFLPAPVTVSPYSIADGVSADGRVVVGQSTSLASSTPNGHEAFRWTIETGMVPLGDLPGGLFQSWAYACSADGSVVVGRASIQGPCGPFGCGSEGRAFIWDAQHGMRNLQQLLIDTGSPQVVLTGWRLLEARGVSADGTTICGNGINPQGVIEGWIAYLPRELPGCPADFNTDGEVNPDDLADYINCFFAVPPCPQSDFNADGTTDADDLGDYINTYFGPAC